MNAYTEILGCDGTALYENDNKQIHFQESGRLQVLLAYDGMVKLCLNDFEYGVRNAEEIVYDNTDPQFKLILYLKRYPKGKYILKINQCTDEVFSCLNEKCYLKSKINNQNAYTSYLKEDEKIEKVERKKKIEPKPKQEEKYCNLQQEDEGKESQAVTAGSVLVSASKGLGWGLKWTGKIISKGFEAVGNLASKSVTPGEQKVQLSDNAKSNIKVAKKTTANIYNFASKQVSNLFEFGKQTASNIGDRFEQSDKGKQLKENPKYENVKDGAKTSAKVISNIYGGIVDGIYEIGSGISKGTSKVVSKKYGEDVGDAADDLFEGAGNIVKISRVANDQAAKTFKD